MRFAFAISGPTLLAAARACFALFAGGSIRSAQLRNVRARRCGSLMCCLSSRAFADRRRRCWDSKPSSRPSGGSPGDEYFLEYFLQISQLLATIRGAFHELELWEVPEYSENEAHRSRWPFVSSTRLGGSVRFRGAELLANERLDLLGRHQRSRVRVAPANSDTARPRQVLDEFCPPFIAHWRQSSRVEGGSLRVHRRGR